MPTVVVASRVNELDPSIRVDVYTYGRHVVEVMYISVHGCIVYDVTHGAWVGGVPKYLTPLAAQLRAFEVLGVTSGASVSGGAERVGDK